MHSGHSVHSGHYYSYVKAPNGLWYLMNDSSVSQVQLKQVLNQSAYLLFYTKLNSEKPIIKKPISPAASPINRNESMKKSCASEDKEVLSNKPLQSVLANTKTKVLDHPVRALKTLETPPNSPVVLEKNLLEHNILNATCKWIISCITLGPQKIIANVSLPSQISIGEKKVQNIQVDMELPVPQKSKNIASKVINILKPEGSNHEKFTLASMVRPTIPVWDHVASSDMLFERQKQIKATEEKQKRKDRTDMLYDQPRSKKQRGFF